jgi:hypothetical protein
MDVEDGNATEEASVKSLWTQPSKIAIASGPSVRAKDLPSWLTSAIHHPSGKGLSSAVKSRIILFLRGTAVTGGVVVACSKHNSSCGTVLWLAMASNIDEWNDE